MPRTFGFEQQSYGVRKGTQHQSYSLHQEESWHSKDDYHGSLGSGVKILPAATSVLFDSQFMKHNEMFDGGHAIQDGWLAQNMHQNQSNGWSGSGSGSGISSNNNSTSGSTSVKKYLPAATVVNASQYSTGGMFNHALMGNGGGSFETIREVKYVPAATVRVQEVRYERSGANWGRDKEEEGQNAASGPGISSNTNYYNHAASGSTNVKKYLPIATVINASQYSTGDIFNHVLMGNGGGSFETIQEVKYVPAATMRVQEVRYERSGANWGRDEEAGLLHSAMGTGMLGGYQRMEPKTRDFCYEIRRAWC